MGLPKPKRIKLKLLLRNRLSIPQPNLKVNLYRIDDDIFEDNPNILHFITNDEGVINKSIPEGVYVAQIVKRKSIFEKVIDTYKKKFFIITTPITFGLFSKKYEISMDKIQEIYEQQRTDLKFCFKCKKRYSSLSDRFKCNYCGKYFCIKHRLPENHNCKGMNNIKSPPSSLREIHTASGKIIAYGK